MRTKPYYTVRRVALPTGDEERYREVMCKLLDMDAEVSKELGYTIEGLEQYCVDQGYFNAND